MDENSQNWGGAEAADPGSDLYATCPFIILKFNGCTASTVIGTLFVTSAISF
jgi:hypothetical protein